MKRLANSIFTLLFSLFLLSPSSFALTLDDFENGDLVIRETVPGSSSSNGAVTSTAVGGARSQEANLESGNEISSRVEFGLLSHLQGSSAATGRTEVIWDGDTDHNSFNPTGLGGVDLAQEFTPSPNPAVDGFQLNVVFSDDAPVDVIITAYSNANRVASLKKTLVQEVALGMPELLIFPFSEFTNISINPVEFDNIGAIKVEIVGSFAPSVDLDIEWFGTTGCSSTIPEPNVSVFDECGVCDGDSTTCQDCLGVPNGNALPGEVCDTGDIGLCGPGVWSGTAPNSCSCVPDYTPQPEFCDGIDNNCDGAVDEAYPQLGTSCGSSFATPLCNVDGVYECSIQGGVQCTADSNSAQMTIDECEDSKGCDGVPNSGLVLDACNLCGGDGTTCADCAGVSNGSSVLDRCGVCNGDGNSCLACEAQNISDLQRDMDNGAIEQDRINRKILQFAKRQSKGTLKRYVKKQLAASNALYFVNWVNAWTALPTEFDSCGNTNFCSSISNEDAINTYQANALSLFKIAKKGAKKARNIVGNVRKIRKLFNNARKKYDEVIATSNEVPLAVSTCS